MLTISYVITNTYILGYQAVNCLITYCQRPSLFGQVFVSVATRCLSTTRQRGTRKWHIKDTEYHRVPLTDEVVGLLVQHQTEQPTDYSYEPEPVKAFFFIFYFLFAMLSYQAFFPQTPSQIQASRRKMRPAATTRCDAHRDGGQDSTRLTAQTPIRAHLAGGTSILIRLKTPILSDVICQF